MKEREKSGRTQLITVLIVCEGYAEEAFAGIARRFGSSAARAWW
jgi:hypothetical protein